MKKMWNLCFGGYFLKFLLLEEQKNQENQISEKMKKYNLTINLKVVN